ncbi:hypothetical protein [Tessaracoccus rhinocerotis]|uniref:hypothetical protein n=1 Tax=Tessaracoccus rhinocerotis TaxID=1689449 RepID=UPI00163D8C6D|nr:hypothetical protein [Tessaracoccus rhinocerotis]
MSTNTETGEFDVEQYQAEHKPPSETESAFITIAMFGGLVIFAVGCWALGGWG